MSLQKKYRLSQYAAAWAVHAFTASAAFLGILTLIKINEHSYVEAFWFMAATILIDAVDGTFARLVNVKEILPHFDGALLDNIVDYLNYVITPCFFLWVKSDLLPPEATLWLILTISMTSAYQFCQADAKTPDHFFKGFPCYWNFAVFYMFIFNSEAYTNLWILMTLSILIFVPIKYVYPSRLDYLTNSRQLKILMHLCSLIYGMSSAFLLWYYPSSNPLGLAVSLGYVLLYLILSLYRTYSPMIIAKIAAHKA
jgi:phosphatidylcholine synthase